MKISRSILSVKLIIAVVLFMTVNGCKDAKQPSQVDLNQLKGIVLMQVGDVKLQKGEEQPVALNIKDSISAGDIIKTGPASYATIQFGDKGVIKILEKTTVKMLNLFGGDSGEIFLDNGQVLSKFEKLQKGDKYSIKTRTAVASVRGTEFSTGYVKGKSYVAVKKGKIALSANTTGDKPDLGKEQPAATEKIIEEGKTAVIQEPVVDTKEGASKTAEPQIDIQVRPISNAESLALEKISIVAIVPEAEKMTSSELKDIQKSTIDKDAIIDRDLKIEVRKEKIKELIQNKPTSMEEIKEVFERIDEITLYNRRVIRGAIISRGAVFKILTMSGTIDVPENQIKSIVVVK